MTDILDIYESLADSIEETDEFRIYDFINYLGINVVDKDLSKEEITRIINICRECTDNFIDSFKLAKSLTSAIYEEEYLTLDELERIPSESIKYFYSNEKMDELEYYFDSYQEILTSTKEILDGYSYTIGRVVQNGYCVELHYCSDRGATLEYGTKTSHDCWENEVEEAEWFNTNLSDDYIINRLNCLYDEEFSSKEIPTEKTEELNLIDHILSNHKVDDITLYLDAERNLFAFDDINCWKNNEFYDFMFNELFVYNQDGKVDLIDDSDYKRLEEYRNNYNENSNDLEMEMEYE